MERERKDKYYKGDTRSEKERTMIIKEIQKERNKV